MMRMRGHGLVPLFLSVAMAAGCASGGRVPKPEPFPAANVPAVPDVSNQVPIPGTALLMTALSLRGIPYVNGGSDPSRGFDCSGFVQWVFAQHGTPLAREVREQYGEGRKISRADVQPGDLVFFQTVSRGPSHVGIALGTGEFVHAPSSRGVVRVENYTTEYWASRWVGARRILSVRL
jgi:cell wall-associated NlpC family hydrolase